MPNWVDINFKVKGAQDELKRFVAEVRTLPTEETKRPSAFDFNRFIPMPASLDVVSGTVGDAGYAVFYGNPQEALASVYNWSKATTIEQMREDVLARHPRAREIADVYHDNIQKYGHATWYDWCNENWHTKWNACDPSVKWDNDDLEVFFQTAWGFPSPIIEMMIEKFPELVFTGTADEEGGHFYLDFTGTAGQFNTEEYSGIREGGPYDYRDEDEEDDE